jgi:hypothetical protein
MLRSTMRYLKAKAGFAMFDTADHPASARSPSPGHSAAVPWQVRQRRSRTTNDPLAFSEALGDPADALTQANILTAAELKVACEDARTKMLEGDGDVDALVRLENLSNRAEKRLGLKAVTKPAGPTLAEHLARRAAERAGMASG